ncbi:MAG: TRAP transporter large permease subunit [Acidobacteriota bacterium]
MRERLFRFLKSGEAWLSIAVLLTMAALPLTEMVFRKVAGRGLPGSIPVVQHLTLWITFLGAALAAGSGRLLALSTTTLLPERWRAKARVFTAALGAGVCACLALASVELVQVLRQAGGIVGWGIPVWTVLVVMPLGFVLIAGRVVFRASERWPGRLLAGLGLLTPVLFARVDVLNTPAWTAPLGLVVLAGTVFGMPIFTALAALAFLFGLRDAIPPAAVPAEVYRLASSPVLPAIPLFTLGGYIISELGASRRLMRVFTALVGWMPGGLAIMTVLLLAFFTPFTGASGVTILSIGGLLLPMLVKAGYPEDTALGLVTVSGSIGLLFPPSLPVILFGISAMAPIDKLFVAGLIPGFILVAAVAAWGAWRGWAAGAKSTPFRWRETAEAIWDAKWELLLPVVILTGLFGGFATLVEVAALTVLYALAVEVFVYKDLKLTTDLPRIAIECSTLAGGFLVILGVALGVTDYLVHAEVPLRALEWMQAHIQSPWVFLLALNVFLLIVGGLMDIYSSILVVVPLILPIALAYGIDPVHLGIVFLANAELGYLTPPMGENLFLSAFRFGKPLARIYASTLPYCVMLGIAVLLITYLPGIGARLVSTP